MKTIEQHTEQIQFTYHPPKSELLIRLIFVVAIGLGMLVFGFNQKYPDLALVSKSLIAFFIGSLILWIYFQVYYLDFYYTYLVAYKRHSKNKQIILYSDILKYESIHIKSKHDERDVLFFQTRDEANFQISSDKCMPDTFDEIQKRVTKNAQTDDAIRMQAKKAVFYRTSFVLIALATAIFALNYLYYKDVENWHPLSNNDVKAISGRISAFEQVSRKGGHWYKLRLNEYPDFMFNIERTSLNALSEDKLKTNPLYRTERVDLLIKMADYNLKIAQTQKPTWRDFYNNFQYIEPCALVKPSSNTVYFNLNDYNKVGSKFHSKGEVVLSISGIFALIGGAVFFYNKR